ncbi:N-acetyl-anhydromuranmyl-L-alanine amidase [Actinobaculum suis]|uniref:N-acetylmuramoyl-L-alanine amidase n=1 Tax=Actinobaculum suis TaxID=1657 RepID=A0A7Z8Y719_9ACTO|nr:N-acetylmuramoyl-L-alanine amidase [Actinobaculum suis]VDG75279.1 N-acetyl-anhydromuranmyl-L-alanine amidase [Actinobaculum suis]
MRLTNLADILRGAGLEVTEVDGWRNRGHADFPTTPKTIVMHHTAGPAASRNGSDYPSLSTVRDGRPGLSGPLAQLGLGRSGRWYVIASGVAWHTGVTWTRAQNNFYAIGVEAENSGSEPWPAAQLDSYRRGVKALADAYGIPYSSVLGHKEICKPASRKPVCPSIDMAAFRASLSSGATPAPAASAAPAQAPAASVGGYYTGRVDGVQRVIDGDLGPMTVKGLQLLLRDKGYYTQKIDGTPREVDGDFGGQTVKALQRWLQDRGYYTEKIDGTRRVVDGEFGPMTVKALQLYLRDRGHYTQALDGSPREVDGDFGPMTVKALQHWLQQAS